MNQRSKFSEPYSLAPYRPVLVSDLVRVGRSHDGGYVISRRCISKTTCLFGAGISNDWSFEQDFSRLGKSIQIVGLDGSVSAGVFRRRGLKQVRAGMEALMRAQFAMARRSLTEFRGFWSLASSFHRFFSSNGNQFLQKYLDNADGEKGMCWTSLRERCFGSTGRRPLNLFVKLDIEGAEYRLLQDLVKDASLINGMVIEFHDCEANWDRFTELMGLLLGPFAVVHLHGNNYSRLIAGSSTPSVLEVSLIHRGLLTGDEPPNRGPYPLPHLDQPNKPTELDYPLAF